MSVKDLSLVEILDKNVDQVQLGKDLVEKYLAVRLVDLKAKIESGEVDLIKGTDLDKKGLLIVLNALEKALLAD